MTALPLEVVMPAPEVSASLPEMVELVMVALATELLVPLVETPPPPPSSAVLPEMVERATVKVPLLEMPPPDPSEKFLGHRAGVMVREPWLLMPPAPPPVRSGRLSCRVSEATSKTPVLAVALHGKRPRPRPPDGEIVAYASWPVARRMVPRVFGAKVMVSALLFIGPRDRVPQGSLTGVGGVGDGEGCRLDRAPRRARARTRPGLAIEPEAPKRPPCPAEAPLGSWGRGPCRYVCFASSSFR